jgi:hypothetical protein
MVLSIFALIILILLTPSLLGRPSPELASLPLLIIGMSRNETSLIVNLGSAVQAYRYDLVRLSTNGSSRSMNLTYSEADTYGFHQRVAANTTLNLHAYFVDHQKNYFEYNVTVRVQKEANNRTVMVFTFPYERDNMNTEIRRNPPDDFRWVIPRRGTLP